MGGRIWRRLAAIALVLACHGALPAQSPTTGPTGDWRGTLDAGAVKLRIALHLGEISSFDGPDQGAVGLPAQMSVADDGLVTVQLIGSGSFEGRLSPDGTLLEGALIQRGTRMPVAFERGTFAARSRPQTPKPPFPYREVQVSYPNPAEPGLTLAGTLTLPQGDGPFPVVLLISGSGTQDRDNTVLEHKSFLLLADALTRRGIASLRVDDRGIGGSGAGNLGATTASFATDVAAGVSFLKTRADIDPRRIGLLGHSEGGVIAPLVASHDRDIAFLVLWAGPAVDGRAIVVDQVQAVARASGASAQAAEGVGQIQAQLIDALLATSDFASARAAMNAVLSNLDAPPVSDASVAVMNAPWFRHFLAFDPGPALRSLDIPVLAMLGGKDTQVTVALNETPLRAAFAGNARAKVEIIPGLNHFFQTAKTGSPDEYGEIEETMSPVAMNMMVDWIAEISGASAP